MFQARRSDLRDHQQIQVLFEFSQKRVLRPELLQPDPFFHKIDFRKLKTQDLTMIGAILQNPLAQKCLNPQTHANF